MSATYLCDAKQLSRVAQTPMTQLMTQDGHDLFRLAFLDQRVVDDDVLLPRQAVEVRVGMRASLASVDNIHLL